MMATSSGIQHILLAVSVFTLPFTITAQVNPRLAGFPPAQVISYQGSLEGAFFQNTQDFPFLASCGDDGNFYFPSEANATLRIGVNPPTIDDNPFFFMLQRDGLGPDGNKPPSPSSNPDLSPSPGPTSTGTVTQTTPDTVVPTTATPRNPSRVYTTQDDPNATPASRRRNFFKLEAQKEKRRTDGTPNTISNLLFSSFWFLCMRGSRPCGMVRVDPNSEASPEWYMSAPMLDLSASQLAVIDAGSYYSLTGDQSSWASNGTVDWNRFNFQPPSNYTPCAGGILYPAFVWNATTPFTYAVNFTATEATMELSITAPMGTIQLSFSGTFVDESRDDGEGGTEPLSLASPKDNLNGPHFTLANGSDFSFEGTSVVANATQEMGLGSGASRSDWTAWGSMMMAVVFAGLLL